MSNVRSLADAKAKRDEPAATCEGKVICGACRHEWHAIAPPGTDHMECPECHLPRGVWRGNFATAAGGTRVFTCSCGFSLFEIREQTVLCIACGTTTTFAELADAQAIR